MTRARRHLAVIGDSETVSHDEFLKSLIDYMNKEGEVRSAQEFVNGLYLWFFPLKVSLTPRQDT